MMQSPPTLPLSCFAALSALAGMSPAALAAQIPTAELVDLPGISSGIDEIYSLSGDASGSWVAMATDLGRNGQPNLIYGVLAGSGTTAPGILRTAQTIGGVPQDTIGFPLVFGDDVAYASNHELSNGTFLSGAWVNDTLIAQTGDSIGSSGLEWSGIRTPIQTSTGLFLRGLARPAGSTTAPDEVIVRYPSQEVVFDVRAPLDELNGPVLSVTTLEVSASGSHWAATIAYSSPFSAQPESAVVVDGEVYRILGVTPLTTEDTNFFGLDRSFVDDLGRVTYAGVNAVNQLDVYEDGLMSQTIGNRVLDEDELGRLLWSSPITTGLGANINGVSLDRPGAGALDADGDGDADLGWAVLMDSSFQYEAAMAFINDGQVLSVRPIQVPSAGVQIGIVRATLALPDVSICPGETNTIGLEASVRVLGSDAVAFNDLELLLSNLPPPATVLPLYSRTQGFAANPGGSAGNLCLGGAIGRGFVVNGSVSTLNLTVRAFPGQLPQPNGVTSAQPGETWFFQAWYRDTGQGGSNFTNAVAVTFR